METSFAVQDDLDRSFLYAFLGGLVVLAWNSWDLLNRPSYTLSSDEERRRSRALRLLAPKDFRSGLVFVKAYIFYFLILATIYTAFTVSGALIQSLKELEEMGSDIAGFTRAFDTVNLSGPGWPLTVSLIMVGLLPSVPAVNKIEERIRYLAHRLVGIPETVFERADLLSRVYIDHESLPLSPTAKLDIDRHTAAAHAALGESPSVHNFEQSLTLIHFFREAFLDSSIYPPAAVRRIYRKLEQEVAPELLALIQDLEDFRVRPIHNPASRDDSSNEDAESALARNTASQRWDAFIQRARYCADDIRMLLALYLEVAGLPDETDALDGETVGAINAGGRNSSRALRDILSKTMYRDNTSRAQIDILLAAVISISAVMYIAGYIGSASGLIDYSRAPRLFSYEHAHVALIYLTGALATYVPASLIMALYRDGKISSGSWINCFEQNHTFPTMQYLGIFAAGYVITVLSLTFHGFIEFYSNTSEAFGVLDRFFRSRIAIDSLWFSVLGAVHAVFLGIVLDRAALGDIASLRWRSFIALPVAEAGALGAIAYFTSITRGYESVAIAHGLLAALFGFLASSVTLWLLVRRSAGSKDRRAKIALVEGTP